MGAYFGAILGAIILWAFFSDILKDIAQQLKRIADRLEGQENDAPPKEPE